MSDTPDYKHLLTLYMGLVLGKAGKTFMEEYGEDDVDHLGFDMEALRDISDEVIEHTKKVGEGIREAVAAATRDHKAGVRPTPSPRAEKPVGPPVNEEDIPF